MTPTVWWSEDLRSALDDVSQESLTSVLGLRFHGLGKLGAATVAHRFIEDTPDQVVLLRVSRRADGQFAIELLSYGADPLPDLVDALHTQALAVIADPASEAGQANSQPAPAARQRDRSPHAAAASLTQHLHLSLVAEQLANPGALHVSTGSRENALDSAQWQVIFGRRGSGKTSLLRRLSYELNQASQASLAVSVSVREALHAGSLTTAAGVMPSASAIFSGLVETTAGALIDAAGRRLSSIRPSPTPSRSSRRAQTEIRELLAVASRGVHLDSRRVGHGSVADLDAPLNRLLDVLGFNRLVLLIDDWDVLTRDVQPAVAELLRQSLAHNPRVTIKLAADRYRALLANDDYGLRFGEDVTVGINLDLSLGSPAYAESFFAQLIDRRLAAGDPAFAVASPHGHPEAAMDCVDRLFDNRSAFAELIDGAEANPRHFLQVLNELAGDHLHTGRWNRQQVREVTRRHWERHAALLPNDAAHFLRGTIRSATTETNSRVFAIDRERPPQFADALNDLLVGLAINDVEDRVVPEAVGHEFGLYWLTYGLWLSWAPGEAAGPSGRLRLPKDINAAEALVIRRR